MSSSAVIHRGEVLALVAQLKAALPGANSASPSAAEQRDTVRGGARAHPSEPLDEAEAERSRLVADTEVHRLAKADAEKLRREVEQEAAELRTETDEYVDGRLATLEISLTKTLEAVARGRARLHGRSHFHQLGDTDSDDGSSVDFGDDQQV